MEWKPEFKPAEQPKPSGDLLEYAKNNFKLDAVEPLVDQHGTFGWICKEAVLVAKSYIYGNIVSAHKRAVYAAFNLKYPLVMYIKSADKYYEFNPKDIMNSEENEKGGEKMLNFDIKKGVEFK